MLLAHIAGVPVPESLAYVLPVVVVVVFIYWSGFRERRHDARSQAPRALDADLGAPAPEHLREANGQRR